MVDENCLMKKKLHQILNVHYRLLILVNHSCYGASKLFSSQGNKVIAIQFSQPINCSCLFVCFVFVVHLFSGVE